MGRTHVLLDQSCVGLTHVLCCSKESSMKGLVSMNSWRSRANCKERLDLVGLCARAKFFFPPIFLIYAHGPWPKHRFRPKFRSLLQHKEAIGFLRINFFQLFLTLKDLFFVLRSSGIGVPKPFEE